VSSETLAHEGQPPKNHRAAFARQLHSGLPRFRFADGFIDHVKFHLRFPAFAALRRGRLICDLQFFHRFDNVAVFADRKKPSPHLIGVSRAAVFRPNRSRPRGSPVFRQGHKHQTNRTGTDDQHILSGTEPRVFHSWDDAGERLNERGIAEISFRFEPQ